MDIANRKGGDPMSDSDHILPVTGAEKILVFITPDPEAQKAVDMGWRRARTMHSELVCLTVETPYYSSLTSQQSKVLKEDLEYVQELGLPLETLVGTDPVYLIREFCRSNRITLLYMTRSLRRDWTDRFRRSISRELMESLPDLSIVLVPGSAFTSRQDFYTQKETGPELGKNILRVAVILALMTLLCYILDSNDADDSVLAPIYILGVLIVGMQTTKWYWPAIAALFSILLFDFFFATPRLSFYFYNPGLVIVYIVCFLISLISGVIGQRMHNTTLQEQRSTWRAQTLLDTTHLMEETLTPKDVIPNLHNRLAQLCMIDTIFFPQGQDMLLDPIVFHGPGKVTTSLDEIRAARSVALAAFESGQSTGASTEIDPECPFFFVPWKTKEATYGVTGIRLGTRPLDPLEKMVVESVVSEGAITLEARQKAEDIARIREQVSSERQRSNMLKAVSHDIRTPLTSIIGNIGALKENAATIDRTDLMALCDELQNNSMTLLNMVENLLTAAHLDNNSLRLRAAPELIEDVVEAGLQQPRKINRSHPIEVTVNDEFLMASMDSSLIAQVVSNMVMNAIQHTDEETPIEIVISRKDKDLLVEVKDEGPGVSDAMKPRIFDLFYTGDMKIIDSNHFLGLGLYLCKAIVKAHNGTIYVTDNQPKGAVFAFTLPLVELN